MLPKDINGLRRPRVAQNSSIQSIQRSKNYSTQTANLGFVEGSSTSIATDGKISKNDQNNYKKAIDFVNKWNNAMSDFLKKKSSNKNQDSKVKECFDFDENLSIATVPNYMAFFVAIQELNTDEIIINSIIAGRNSDSKRTVKKNSYTQTKISQEKVVVDVKSQTQYVRFAEETTENVENIPKQIQKSQYGTYPHKNPQKSLATDNYNHCPPLKHNTRFSESNIRQTSPNPLRNDTIGRNTRDPTSNCVNPTQNSPLRQKQSFVTFSGSSSGTVRHRRTPTGLLSPNGMIASEINANGTPIVVRDMFEKVQNPVGVFVSQGNILKNISRSDSSSSSVILSDKESGEVKFEMGERDDHLERTSSPYRDEGRYGGESFVRHGESSGCDVVAQPIKNHPLNLNERDLNSKDKNFISSIGIFTEAGELKQNAKSYLEMKEDVRKGTFRAPRLSQLHMTDHYNAKSCTSESLLSDIVSTRSSEFEE
ncbi:uncharacterized protein LOC123316671 [Coccinella septempunctata]|uniref:uncharacterized protein LOC123316671 n=1 Tax=Coccinella septempunctata TaxID=41139 RepID=UPI001D06FE16|nr:uncharacterized protein LOC123316671 [Coccinella septempunctata]